MEQTNILVLDEVLIFFCKKPKSRLKFAENSHADGPADPSPWSSCRRMLHVFQLADSDQEERFKCKPEGMIATPGRLADFA